jgi:chemotaxis protein CheX
MSGVAAADVDRVVVETWSSLLGLTPVRLPQPPSRTVDRSAPGQWVHAVVVVDGPWNGTVHVSAPDRLAARCAGAMLDVAPGDVDAATTADAFGELANVVGGNLKALMPTVCHLSLPTVAHSTHGPGSDVLTLAFDCGGDVLVVSVHPRAEHD